MENQESRIELLRLAIIEGENSGPARPFDMKAFVKAKTGKSR